MPWEVLLTEETTPEDLAGAGEFATFVDDGAYPDRDVLLADADRFDAVVVRTFEVDEAFLDAATSLAVIAKRGVGVDNIDIGAATERGVLVCNTPGANARAVAEHALALLLSVRHRVVVADRETRRGRWDREQFVTSELGGDVLGTFGAGNTGRTLARLADGIGMDVLAHDPYVDAGAIPDGVEMVGTVAELFERADAVSVHAPLTGDTRGAIGAPELDALGSEGILINTARGGIVDEDALVAALRKGTIAGAGLDVCEAEPPPEDHPLFDLDAVVVTPHVAGWTEEADAAKNRGVVANLRAVHGGDVPESTLNPGAAGR